MIERANQVDRTSPPPSERGAEPPTVTGRTGIRYAILGMLIVVAWLVVCMLLRRIY